MQNLKTNVVPHQYRFRVYRPNTAPSLEEQVAAGSETAARLLLKSRYPGAALVLIRVEKSIGKALDK